MNNVMLMCKRKLNQYNIIIKEMLVEKLGRQINNVKSMIKRQLNQYNIIKQTLVEYNCFVKYACIKVKSININ